MKQRKGIIIKTFRKRGFGYIQDEDGKEIYFHAAGTVRPKFEKLREGNAVKFYLAESSRGVRAIGVVATHEEVKEVTA